MSLWSELLERPKAEEHFVQLYARDDQLLIRNVSRYLLEGLRLGDGLVMIANGDHASAIVHSLAEQSPAAAEAITNGWFAVLDAETTLEKFLVDGQPDQDLFRTVVGGTLSEVKARSSTGRVRAFGEMVAVLWEAGRQSAAIRLEEFWNELLAGSLCSLFCAYSIDIFEDPQTDSLAGVIGVHTHTHAGRTTILSSQRAAR
jgi:MEDS: MEthanogen/methylotroph, DcmR Sensory domain